LGCCALLFERIIIIALPGIGLQASPRPFFIQYIIDQSTVYTGARLYCNNGEKMGYLALIKNDYYDAGGPQEDGEKEKRG
jgi:hypothetical protein